LRRFAPQRLILGFIWLFLWWEGSMSQLVLYIALSLDGYMARTCGEVDWLFIDQDYGYEDFYATCDRLIMGRNTYKQIQFWGVYPYPDKQGFVFSRTI